MKTGSPALRAKIRSLAGRGIRVLREIVYPEGTVCAGCGKLSDGNYLCPACRGTLRNSDLLESWERRDLDGAEAWSIRPHRDLPRQLVLRLKHGAEARAAEELMSLLRDRPASRRRPPRASSLLN